MPFCVTPIRSSSNCMILAVASSSLLFTSSFSSSRAWEECCTSCETEDRSKVQMKEKESLIIHKINTTLLAVPNFLTYNFPSLTQSLRKNVCKTLKFYCLWNTSLIQNERDGLIESFKCSWKNEMNILQFVYRQNFGIFIFTHHKKNHIKV